MTHTKNTIALSKSGAHKDSQKAPRKRLPGLKFAESNESENKEESPEAKKRKASRKTLFKRRCRMALDVIKKDKFVYNKASSLRQIVWSMFNSDVVDKSMRYRLRPESIVLIHQVASSIARDIMKDSKMTTATDCKTTLQGKRLKTNTQIWSKYNDSGFFDEVMTLYKQICKPDDSLLSEKPLFDYY